MKGSTQFIFSGILIRKAVVVMSALLVLLLFTTCDFFKPGLGSEVDIDRPNIDITSHRNGDYVGGEFQLSGTAEDDIGIESVTIEVNGNTLQADYSAVNWQVLVDTTGFADGDHEFVITARDNSGKYLSVDLLLIVDNKPPTVQVTTPSIYGSGEEFNQYVSIKGEAADTTRVRDVRISLYSAADSSPVFEDDLAIGTTSWYYVFDATGLNGVYYFFVSASDYSGNTNTYFYHFSDVLGISVNASSMPNIEQINDSDYKNMDIPDFNDSLLEDIRLGTTAPSRMEIGINPDSDMPQFTFISPVIVLPPSDPFAENVFAAPQRLTGFVEDDDGTPTSVMISIHDYDSDLLIVDWTSDGLVMSGGSQWSYTANLPDGNYYVQLRATDIYGTVGESPIALFRVSSFAPVIAITQPLQGTYVGNDTVLPVTVSVSSLGSGNVVLDPDGDSDWSDALEMTDIGGGVFGITMTAGSNFTVTPGEMLFRFRAGTPGNFGYATLQLTGDIGIPTVDVDIPLEGANMNGVTTIIGSANDNALVSNVYLWIEEVGNPATLPPADYASWNIPDGSNLYKWSYLLDTTTRTNGDYRLHIKAFDAAGNESADFFRSFMISQESDRPVFSLSNLVAGGTTVENGLGRDASIIGLVEDDDAIDVSSLQVRIDLNNDGDFSGIDLNSDGDILDANESEQWVAVSNRPGANSKIVSWSHSLVNVPQGVHSVQFRVHDIHSGGVPDESANYNYAEVISTVFMIDYGPPSLTITAPVNAAVFNTSFNIYGNASDANGIDDIEISVNGGGWISVMVEPSGTENATWTYAFAVDPDGANDGEYSYQVRATDLSGGRTTLDRQLTVDATAPLITINQPELNEIVNGRTVSVRGEAVDLTRRVDTVYYYITEGALPPPVNIGDWTVATGTTSWNFTFNSLDYNAGAGPGTFVINMRGLDSASNLSDNLDRTIIIDQSTDRPIISFSDIDKNEILPENNLLVGATMLSGIVEDDDMIDPSMFGGNAIEINIDNTGWAAVSNPPASSGKVVSWKHNITSLDEGLHRVKIRARDNQSAGTVGNSSVSPEYTSDYNWNIEDSADQNGVPFILNLGPPSILLSTPPNFTYHNSNVFISGTAADNNEVEFMWISFDNSTTWITIPVTRAEDVNWNHTFVVESDGSTDGSYGYLVRATDAFGSSSIENGQFTVDATAPGTTINQPVDGATVNGTITISGTGYDNISLSRIYYNISPAVDPAPAVPAAYTQFPGSYAWTAPVDTTLLPDAEYTLRIVALDSAGNYSDPDSINFVIDQSSDRPEIGFTSIEAAGTFVSNLLPPSRQVLGVVSDDDSVHVASIQYRLYAEDGLTVLTDWTAISDPPATNRSPASWTHAFTEGDGKYQVQLRAADIYDAGAFTSGGFGWSESGLVQFAIDTANPATTITSPATTGGYTNTDFLVEGVASDAGGIKTIEIQFGALPSVLIFDGGAGPYNTSEPWSYLFNVDEVTHTTDGLLYYTVTVTDAYDKTATAERYINVDTRSAEITGLQLVNNSLVPGEVNGSALIQGSANDYETMVAAVYVRIDTGIPGEPGVNPVADGWTLLSGTNTINYRFNTTLLLDNTDYTVYLLVQDVAGNRSSVGDYTIAFHTNQSGNSPVITIATLADSLLRTSDSITGTIIDDDKVDVSRIEISFDGGVSWNAVTSTSPASDSSNVSFSYPLTSVSPRMAAYSVQLRAWDTGEDFTDDSQDIAPVTADSGFVNIFVDNGEPSAVITEIDNGIMTSPTLQGLYINDRFIISGTAADDVQVADVRARLAFDGAFAQVDNTGTSFSTWEWERTGLSIADTQVIMTLEVEDFHGRISSYSYTLLVDSQTPDVHFITLSDTYHGDLSIRGTSSDNIQVTAVYLAHGTGIPADPVAGDPENDPAYIRLASIYSWNYSLDTRTINNTDSDLDYYISVVSVDGAGNVSDKEDLAIVINQASDTPNLLFSNVDSTLAASQNLLESNAKILGSADDDDGLASIEFRTSADQVTWSAYSPITTDGTTPVSVSGITMNWQNHVAHLGEGVHFIQFRIRDIHYTGPSTPFNEYISDVVAFTIDISPPSVSITGFEVDNAYGAGTIAVPVSPGALINNSFLVSGSVNDGNAVSSVRISTDGVNFEDVDTVGEPNWSHSFTITRDGTFDGDLPLYITAIDEFLKSTTISLVVKIDTTEPVIIPTQPADIGSADPANVNGPLTLRGTINEQSAIASFSAVGGIYSDVSLPNTGSGLSWEFFIDTDLYAGSVNGPNYSVETPSGSNIWRFPITMTAFDAAGNRNAQLFHLDISPDSDKPQLFLSTPSDGSSVAGAFVVQGTATDDDSVLHVTLQVDLDDDGLFTSAYDLDGSSIIGDSDFEDESVPVVIPVTNGTWSMMMNQANELAKATIAAAGHAGADGWIGLRFIPYDIDVTRSGDPSLAGDPADIRVYIDSTAPVIEGQGQPQPTPSNGSLVRGDEVTVSARFRDDAPLENTKMQVSFDGGVTYQTILAAGGTITPLGLSGGYYSYDIDLDIDTTAGGGIVSGGNGILQTVLRVTDETYKQNSMSIQLNVDNTLPTAEFNYNNDLEESGGIYTFYGNATDGGDYMLIGRAEDTGTISGIESVQVYFVKGGNFYNPGTGAVTPVATATVPDMSGTGQVIPYITDPSYLIDIDKRSERGLYDDDPADGDQDGFQESLRSMGTFDQWFVYFDTTVFPDGPMDMYTVVYDNAGNYAYELVNIQISNNPPSITGFADHSNGTLWTGNPKLVKYSGSFSLDVYAIDTNANPGLAENGWRLDVSEKWATMTGGVPGGRDAGFVPFFYNHNGSGGAVRAFSSYPAQGSPTGTGVVLINTLADGFEEGAWYRCVASIVDIDGITTSDYFYLKINNSDTTSPVVSFDPGNLTQDSVALWTKGQGPLQAGIDATDINTGTDTITHTLPTWITNGTRVAFANGTAPTGLVPGNVYYVINKTAGTFQLGATSGAATPVDITAVSGTYRLVSGGRVEAQGADDLYSTNDANVSGSVLLFGTVSDDTDVQGMTVSINGGAALPVLLSNRRGDVIEGYTYDWNFLWDTSTVAEVASDNVSLNFEAYDYASTPNTGTVGTQADVMPYITSITDSSGLSNALIRGARGRYSIIRGAGTLVLRGFNFNNSPQARITSSPTTWTGGLAPATTVVDANQITVSRDIARSGWLTVVVNNVPSLNNLNRDNDGSHDYNMETTADPRTAQWTDDRYLWVWATTQVNISTYNGPGSITDYYYPDMVMRADQPEFSFTDESVGNVNYTTSDTAAVKRTGFRLNRYATMAAATVNGTYQRFILTSYDSTYGLNNTGTGHLEVTGFGDQGNNQLMNNQFSPSSGPDDGGTLRWSTIQGNDYYDGTQTNNTYRKWDRYPYPKMIAESSSLGANHGANLWIAYYDSSPYRTVFQNLNFVSFRKTGANNAGDNLANNNQDYRRATEVISIPGTDNGRSSQYFDMVRVGTTGGIAVAYYDPSIPGLRMAYSHNAYNVTGNAATENLTNMSATWNLVNIDTSADVGRYVSLTADNGKLFIAYYDFDDASLKLARVDWDGSAAAPSNISSVYIDRYLSTGLWTNVEMVTNQALTGQTSAQPVIAYYSNADNGTRNSIRFAYPAFDATAGGTLSTAGTSDDADFPEYTGLWDVVTVQAMSPPRGGSEKFQKTQLGVYSAGTLPVVGWVGDRPEYAKLQPLE